MVFSSNRLPDVFDKLRADGEDRKALLIEYILFINSWVYNAGHYLFASLI